MRIKELLTNVFFGIALLLIFIVFGYFLGDGHVRDFVLKFLNSGFFIAMVTLGTGSLIIFVYTKQQNDYKRNAAKLILQEVRYAEQQIRNAKMTFVNDEPIFSLAIKLLPTNSWHKNVHLFVDSLKESQIDFISNFYSQAAYIDNLIEIISEEKSRQVKILRSKIAEFDSEGNPSRVSITEETVLSSGFSLSPNKEGIPQIKFGAHDILKDVVEKTELIYNSSAIDRLREIAGGK